MQLLASTGVGLMLVCACVSPRRALPVPTVVHEAVAPAAPVRESSRPGDFSIDMGVPIDVSRAILSSGVAAWQSSPTDPFKVESIRPDAPLLQELLALFPDAQWEGWRFEALFDANLYLSVEDARNRMFAGHGDVRLESGKPVILVCCIQFDELPDDPRDEHHRLLTVYRSDNDRFELVLCCRIDAGSKGAEPHRISGETIGPTRHEDEGYRWPLSIHSWNGEESEEAAWLALVHGNYTIKTSSKWFTRPLDTWPEPVWVLFFACSRL